MSTLARRVEELCEQLAKSRSDDHSLALTQELQFVLHLRIMELRERLAAMRALDQN